MTVRSGHGERHSEFLSGREQCQRGAGDAPFERVEVDSHVELVSHVSDKMAGALRDRHRIATRDGREGVGAECVFVEQVAVHRCHVPEAATLFRGTDEVQDGDLGSGDGDTPPWVRCGPGLVGPWLTSGG